MVLQHGAAALRSGMTTSATARESTGWHKPASVSSRLWRRRLTYNLGDVPMGNGLLQHSRSGSHRAWK
jgi:hypothetical protein